MLTCYGLWCGVV